MLLCRECCPPPHVTEQGVQSLHSARTQSTGSTTFLPGQSAGSSSSTVGLQASISRSSSWHGFPPFFAKTDTKRFRSRTPSQLQLQSDHNPHSETAQSRTAALAQLHYLYHGLQQIQVPAISNQVYRSTERLSTRIPITVLPGSCIGTLWQVLARFELLLQPSRRLAAVVGRNENVPAP